MSGEKLIWEDGLISDIISSPEDAHKSRMVRAAASKAAFVGAIQHSPRRQFLTTSETESLEQLQQSLQSLRSSGGDLPDHPLLEPGKLSALSAELVRRSES